MGQVYAVTGSGDRLLLGDAVDVAVGSSKAGITTLPPPSGPSPSG
jgi:hypothetical protein